MKTSLRLAVSAFALTFNFACGAIEDDASQVSGTGTCQIIPNCKQTLPSLGRAPGFDSFFKKVLYSGYAHHRARDILTVPGADPVLHAKFTYGPIDKDLKGEKVDVYLSSACTSPLKKIGTVVTSQDDVNPTTENVRDSGGRIFTKLSQLGVRNLPVGRHRILFVVQADQTMTEAYVNVVEPSSKVVVSDIDGTLTSSELAAATEIIGIQPSAHPAAADALMALRKRGYQIFYLTARPEWLMPQTREWLKAKGFPPGTIHTTDSKIGAQGDAAKQYKINEIALLRKQTGIVPSFAFGNKPSDVDAFSQSGIPAQSSYYYKLDGDAQGGVNHADYAKLAAGFAKLPVACK